MREWITAVEFLNESRRMPSPELLGWLARWVESSYQIQDQIERFEAVREEASHYLNVSYPSLYRGMSVTEADLDRINSGEVIDISAHALQSWTKSRMIADDYALPGFGGDVGVLVRKPGSQLDVCIDIQNLLRFTGKKYLGTDAAREKEVVVATRGSIRLSAKDILKVR